MRAIVPDDFDINSLRRLVEYLIGAAFVCAVGFGVAVFASTVAAADDNGESRWRFATGAAIAPETQLSETAEETVIIHGLPFNRTVRRPVASGVGLTLWGDGEYAYPIADDWRLIAGAKVERKEYRGGMFDQWSVAGRVGWRWHVVKGTVAHALATTRRDWQGGDGEYRDVGAQGEVRHRFAPNVIGSVGIARHEREYDKRNYLDGPITSATVGAQWTVSPTARVYSSVALARERAELERFRNEKRSVSLGATLKLSLGFTVAPSLKMTWAEYEGAWSGDDGHDAGRARSDTVRHWRLGIRSKHLSLLGASPEIGVAHVERASNIDALAFGKTYFEMRMAREF